MHGQIRGKLRLGVGDSTVMDALSVACPAGGPLRPRIERAYRVCADLGLSAAGAVHDQQRDPAVKLVRAAATR